MTRTICFACCLLLAHHAVAGDAPFGAPEFYPSDVRPIGFMADGRGHYPGATPAVPWPAVGLRIGLVVVPLALSVA